MTKGVLGSLLLAAILAAAFSAVIQGPKSAEASASSRIFHIDGTSNGSAWTYTIERCNPTCSTTASSTMSVPNGNTSVQIRDAWVTDINTNLGLAGVSAVAGGDSNFTVSNANIGDTAFRLLIGVCEVKVGNPCTFNPTVSEYASVGGVAGEPDLNQLAAADGASGGTSVAPYAAGGGAAGALALAAIAAGMWYVKRRRSAA